MNIAHIHPMLVHFPIALTPVAVALQLFTLFKKESLFEKKCVQTTAVGVLLLAAIFAVVAAIFGDIAFDHALDAGVKAQILEDHEELGMTSAWIISLLAATEIFLYRRHITSTTIGYIAAIAGVAMVLLLVTTAFFGGNLVYEHGVNVAHLPEINNPAP